MGFSWVVIRIAFLFRHNFGNPLCALLTDNVGYVVFAIILCKLSTTNSLLCKSGHFPGSPLYARNNLTDHREGHEAHEAFHFQSVLLRSLWLITKSQSAGITALACRRHVHPAVSPTPRPRVKIALLFHSTPFSNSADRKFCALRAVILAKSKWQ